MCPCIVGVVVALTGHEGDGRCGLASLALPGQEGNCVWLKRDATINMLLGGVCGEARGWGGARLLPQ